MFVTYVHTRSEHIAHIFIRKFSITSTGIRKNYCNGSVKFMTGKRVDRNGYGVIWGPFSPYPKYLNVPTA